MIAKENSEGRGHGKLKQAIVRETEARQTGKGKGKCKRKGKQATAKEEAREKGK